MLRNSAIFCRGRSLNAAPAILAVLAISVPLSLGCGGDDSDGSSIDASMQIDAGVSASCLEAVNHSDLAWVQDEIITPSCAAFNACHRGAAAQAKNLNLEAGNLLINTSGIASQNDPTFDLIVEGDAGASYILMVMGREPIPSGVVINNTMPFGNPLLCGQKREAVARWIDSL